MTPTQRHPDPTLTRAELLQAYAVVAQPGDPDLDTLQRHACRYLLLLAAARNRRQRTQQPQPTPGPDGRIPAPDHWPPNVAHLHPTQAPSSSTTVVPLRRRSDASDIDFKSRAAGELG